jgi:GTP diphosphokinase / guanosine-3',5'-bis(diphosphate) 3'-diphosphatase
MKICKYVKSLKDNSKFLIQDNNIQKAIRYCIEKHHNQTRASGEVYHNHPLEVANIVFLMNQEEEVIIAAILHDLVEDTNVTLLDIEVEFGEKVAKYVDSLTKPKKSFFGVHEDYIAAKDYKLFTCIADNINVGYLKLADRVHNMRTIQHLSKDKQIRIARETQMYYVPLAHFLKQPALQEELKKICSHVQYQYSLRKRIKDWCNKSFSQINLLQAFKATFF